MRHGRDDGDVGARCQRQVMRGLVVRAFDGFGPARVDDDQLRALAQPLLHAGGEDRVPGMGVGADDHDDIGLFDAVEILRAGRGAIGLAQAIAGGRMADAGAGVGVVVAEHRAGQFLDEVGLFVGAARRGDDAHRLAAVFRLDRLHPGGGEVHRLGPGDFAPGLVDGFADHRLEDAVLVAGVAIGEASLHAGMAAVGLAVLVGRHADQFIAAHFGLEAAADAAIGAGGDDAAVRRADVDHRLFLQGRRRAGLHAGAAGDAIRGERVVGLGAEGHAAVEAPAFDGQRKGALHLLARADAALQTMHFAGS